MNSTSIDTNSFNISALNFKSSDFHGYGKYYDFADRTIEFGILEFMYFYWDNIDIMSL